MIEVNEVREEVVDESNVIPLETKKEGFFKRIRTKVREKKENFSENHPVLAKICRGTTIVATGALAIGGTLYILGKSGSNSEENEETSVEESGDIDDVIANLEKEATDVDVIKF